MNKKGKSSKIKNIDWQMWNIMIRYLPKINNTRYDNMDYNLQV